MGISGGKNRRSEPAATEAERAGREQHAAQRDRDSATQRAAAAEAALQQELEERQRLQGEKQGLSKELDAERAKLNQAVADKGDRQKQLAALQQQVGSLQGALQDLKDRRSRECDEALQRQKQDAAAKQEMQSRLQQLEHELRDLKTGADRVAQEWNCERTKLEAAARAAQDQAGVLRKTLDDEGRYRAELQEKLRQKDHELADARRQGIERAAPHAAQGRETMFGTASQGSRQGADAVAAGPGGRQGPPTGVEVGGLPAGRVDGVSKDSTGFKFPGKVWAGLHIPQSPRGISGGPPFPPQHHGMAQRGGRGRGRGRGSQTGWGYDVPDFTHDR